LENDTVGADQDPIVSLFKFPSPQPFFIIDKK